MTIVAILLTILALGILIAIHEFGHFIAARLCGVGVIEFAIGMGKVIYSKQGKETLFTLRAIPFGGFCKMVGEEESDDAENSLEKQGKLKRIFIFIAGALMNLILAFVIFATVYTAYGTATTSIGQLTEGGPAELAGLQAGDRIVAINDMEIKEWNDIGEALALKEVGEMSVVIVYRSQDDAEYTYSINTAAAEDDGRAVIGITPKYRKNVFTAIGDSVKTIGTYIKMIFTTLGDLIRGLAGLDVLSGPIGIVGAVNQSITIGFAYYIQLIGLLSVSLAVMNLLPIPALDGSRVLLILIEAIKGSPIKKEHEGIFHFVGFIALILLAVVISVNDIINLF